MTTYWVSPRKEQYHLALELFELLKAFSSGSDVVGVLEYELSHLTLNKREHVTREVKRRVLFNVIL